MLNGQFYQRKSVIKPVMSAMDLEYFAVYHELFHNYIIFLVGPSEVHALSLVIAGRICPGYWLNSRKQICKVSKNSRKQIFLRILIFLGSVFWGVKNLLRLNIWG